MLRSYSISKLRSRAFGIRPEKSTCTEWSMTRSTGTCGLTFLGSPPNSTIPSRRAAISTTAGTPVKSCRITRLGMNGISAGVIVGFQFAILFTSSSVTRKSSAFLNAASSNTLIEYGRSESETPHSASFAGKE